MATITTTAAQVTATGITAPKYSDVLSFLIAKYQGIFGSDVYLGPDSQEGEFLAVVARSIVDSNSTAVSIFNSFSPSTSTGAALSSMVKINGLTRNIATNSTVDLLLTGVAGTVIPNGVVGGTDGNRWDLPPNTTIDDTGQITVTATCETVGAVAALPNTVTTILTPALGWQSATNLSASVPGAPVEDDATLRQRQAASTALPSLTVLDGMIGAVNSVDGVTRMQAYENSGSTTDANGVPAKSLAFVVEGGDAQAIANAIGSKKAPGVGLAGTTSETYVNASGISQTINFYRPTDVPIAISLNITALVNYTSDIGNEIVASLVAYVNALPIGQKVIYSRLYNPALLSGAADSQTYEITSLQVSGAGLSLGSADIPVLFNQVATMAATDVTLTVSTI